MWAFRFEKTVHEAFRVRGINPLACQRLLLNLHLEKTAHEVGVERSANEKPTVREALTVATS